MNPKLRGHHLLCMLGFRGMGYSETYAVRMAEVQEQLRAFPDTQITLVSGPDDLCLHFPEHQPNHCENEDIHRQDGEVLARLGFHAGETVRWFEIEQRIRDNIHHHDLDAICNGCRWLPYGVCKEGVARVHAGEGLMKLGTASAVAPRNVIQETVAWVRSLLEHEHSGHDWWHVQRVWKLTQQIALKEGGNMFICELAALVHDVIDDKVTTGNLTLQALESWLTERVSSDVMTKVLEIITSMSYQGGTKPPVTSLEARIVQDADRLDAIGAIGIARTFAYSGAKGQPIHQPNLAIREAMSFDDYRHGPSTAINHFYEKLLRLEKLMNTDTARAIARHRHQFLEAFLHEFFMEWDGEY